MHYSLDDTRVRMLLDLSREHLRHAVGGCTGPWSNGLRFWLALPVAFLGAALVTWGMVTLGARRTSGLADALVARGPYPVTRNPQYVGDFLLFLGITIFANSASSQ
jgi:protein-S-isoprenylcysteine O-methyltransferase Ste14